MLKNNEQERSTEAQCSFCSKSQNQVDRLTAGPGGLYICNECVVLYRERIEDGAREPILERKLVRVCNSCGTSCSMSYRYCFNCGTQLIQEM